MKFNKKVLFISSLCAGMLMAQSFIKPKPDDDHFTNLKILPKNISEKDLHTVMKNFSMSLGVRCNFCHVAEQVPGQQHPNFDFASDAKQEKIIARKMMMMVSGINENYLAKMIGGDHTLESINCVTCHMGHKTPIVSVDSLAK